MASTATALLALLLRGTSPAGRTHLHAALLLPVLRREREGLIQPQCTESRGKEWRNTSC